MNEQSIELEKYNGREPSLLDIVTWPNEVLSTKCEDVTEFNDELKHLIIDMYYTMRIHDGIGLAAPQIGKNIRLTTIMLEQPLILINPCIIQTEGKQTTEEGCLSVPGYFSNVTRAEKIRVVYQNEEGVHNQLTAKGFAAVVIQHELEHLDGKVFVENLSPIKQFRAKQKVKKFLKSTKKA